MDSRKTYNIGDGWLEVQMTANEARRWNDCTMGLSDLRALQARRSGDGDGYETLGELLDSERVSRDDLTEATLA